jgi:site-specific DNA recombinase
MKPQLKPKHVRLVGYIRVSTDEQAAEGVSLDMQRAKLEQYVATYDERCQLIDVETDSLSGKTLDRPGLQRILRMFKSGDADGIVVMKLDRLTRRVRDLGYLIENFFAEGKYALISVYEHIDATTAAGRLMLHILASVAQWERETIAERTKAALAHLKDTGVHVGATGLGWEHSVDVDAHGRRVIIENAREQATIGLITKLDGEGKSLREIAEALNDANCPTKRGGKWHPQTVKLILERAGE